MHVRKTITVFALCLAALLPLCLSGFFIAGRIIVRITMLEKMEQDQLQTISLPTDQIQWYKKNHELIVNGKMFDVKSIQQVGDSSIITGLFDEEDTELHEALAGMHEQKNKGHNNSLLLFQVCLGIIAEQIPYINQPISVNYRCLKLAFAQYKDGTLQSFLPIFSPPPDASYS